MERKERLVWPAAGSRKAHYHVVTYEDLSSCVHLAKLLGVSLDGHYERLLG